MITTAVLFCVSLLNPAAALAGAAEPTLKAGVAASAGGITVLDSGDLRFAASLTNGSYGLRLLRLNNDATSGEWFSPATTLISLPTSEPFPGNEESTEWNRMVPDRRAIWRIESKHSTSPTKANPLSLDLDTGYISFDEVAPGSTAFTMNKLTTTSGGYFTTYQTFSDGQDAYPDTFVDVWSTQPGREQSDTRNIGEGSGDAPSSPFPGTGFVFSAPGVYCLDLSTVTQKADGSGDYAANSVFTFAVGTDPATVTPCPQPGTDPDPIDPTDPTDPGTTTTILDSGDLRLAAALTKGQMSQGLLNVDATRRRVAWSDPTSTIISIPNRDQHAWPIDGFTSASPEGLAISRAVGNTGDHLYRTRPSSTVGQTSEDGYYSNSLSVATDAEFINAPDLADGAVSFGIGTVTGPAPDAYFTTFRTSGAGLGVTDGNAWDTRRNGYRGTIKRPAGPGYLNWGSAATTREGFAFSTPGRYCVTVRSRATLSGHENPSEAFATYTFAVGINPAQVTPCAQTPGGVIEQDAPEEGLLDDVAYISKGHVDIGPTLGEDGRLRLSLFHDRDAGITDEYSTDDAILVLGSEYGRQVSTAEESFFAPEGSDYWLFPSAGTLQHSLTWPGLSTLKLKQPFERGVQFRLLGVRTPEGGRVAVYDGSEAGAMYFSTVTGLPGTREVTQSHIHQNWAFTRPGLYCLTMQTSVRGLTDPNAEHTAIGQLTVAVGDIPLAGVEPCGRSEEPIIGERQPLALDSVSSERYIPVRDEVFVTPYLTETGAAEVVARTRQGITDTPALRDIESVVFTAPRSAGGLWMTENGLVWQWDGQYAEHDTAITLGDVDGPGAFQSNVVDNHLDSSTTSRRTTVWRDRYHYGGYTMTAPGTYCVPWTFEIPTDTGTASVTKTLTYVAGNIDPATVELCAQGGHGTDPGGEEPGPDERRWETPNGSLTDSGATIINNGHVDVASLLEDGKLVTRIKDDTTGATDPVFRPTDQTVLQLTPFTQTTITSPVQSFIGAVGDTIWQINESPQDGLLWPGWSTEKIPLDATTGGVNWRLTKAQGPGEVAVYANGAAQVYFNTRDGITAADQFEIPKNTHAHGNWAFTAEGTYCLAFTRSATLTSGETVSDDFTLAFAVGNVDVKKVDPTKCFTEPTGQPSEPDTTPVAPDTLNEGNTGGVQVLAGGKGFTPGQLVTAQVGKDRAGQWVSAWLDDTSWLGWVQVGGSGAIQVRLPADAAPGGHQLVVKHRDGALIGWDVLSVINPVDPGGKDPDENKPGGETPIPDAVWNVPNGTVNAKGATVLNNGHVDIASLIEGDRLVTQVKDTSASNDPVWRPVGKSVLQLLPNARATVPAGDQWRFLGASGAGFYQVSQTQQSGLLWPGWSTEAITLTATTGGVSWALTDKSGPGEFALYLTDSVGQPQVLFNTRDGIGGADRFTIPKNTHAHGSWAFSQQGNYCLSMQRTAQLASGKTVSDQFVLAVAVGTADVMQIDPARCGETVNTTPVDLTPPPADHGGGNTDAVPAVRNVAANQCVAQATILSSGHIDYATRILGGKVESLIGDDTSGKKVYRQPSGTILWLKPSSRVSLPAGYGAVGSAGARVWQVPQTQNPNLIWLGWNTEALNAGNTRGPVQWRINSVNGPGSVKVYLSGPFGGVQQMVFNNGGSYTIPLGVHAHANWAFSAEGIYRISMTQTATLANGQTSSDTETLTIAVGNVDPATAAGTGTGCGPISNAMLLSDDPAGTFEAAQQALAEAAAAARDLLPGQGTPLPLPNPVTALNEGDPVPLLLSILGGLLLAGAAGTGTLWWRGRRGGL
ncbi:MAG: TIGR03773 family transporter-associated surface protein [Propioniciclava sp.]|uniref:TIGR03773 family transporter-associated surface protein n=1 Tax=Propioniciclava sp. TaxID=2038686 RepID=UPI0039E51BE7